MLITGGWFNKTLFASYHFIVLPASPVAVKAIGDVCIQNSVVSPSNFDGMGLIVNVRLYGLPEHGSVVGFVGLTTIVIVSLMVPVFVNNKLIDDGGTAVGTLSGDEINGKFTDDDGENTVKGKRTL